MQPICQAWLHEKVLFQYFICKLMSMHQVNKISSCNWINNCRLTHTFDSIFAQYFSIYQLRKPENFFFALDTYSLLLSSYLTKIRYLPVSRWLRLLFGVCIMTLFRVCKLVSYFFNGQMVEVFHFLLLCEFSVESIWHVFVHELHFAHEVCIFKPFIFFLFYLLEYFE